ncbi:MAG: hypothetical protein AAFO94_10660 [Bacteroidota bacterium]
MRAFFFFLFLLSLNVLSAQAPGDLFREYHWTLPDASKDAGFLRLGGKLDYRSNAENLPTALHDNGKIPLGHEVDLAKAVKAELIIEKVLSHEGTTGLEMQVNDNQWIVVPESQYIPAPQSLRPHHFRPIVSLPLAQLRAGNDNHFELRVDEEHPWNWPQHLIYGVTLRVYYSLDKKHVTGTIKGLNHGQSLGENIVLQCSTSDTAYRVDYLAHYEDVNREGDGRNRQWHYLFHRGQLSNHIGSAYTAPYVVNWSTEWMPDQSEGIRLAARIQGRNGLIYMTPAIEDLKLVRKHHVELISLNDPPEYWTTRNNVYTSTFDVQGPPAEGMLPHSAVMCWTSWSPCYDHGVFINGTKVTDGAETPCYDFYQHEVPLDVSLLKNGKNELKTAKTPLYNGQMVHGMEVQYPGMQIKLRYELPAVQISDDVVDEGQAAFKITTPHGTYFYQKAAGGFSSMLDRTGRDWIGFRQTDQASYPASAASDYRGLPNSVFAGHDDGAGHPGFDRCVSVQVAPNKIRTFSKSGKWQWSWTFQEAYAELEIERVDSSRAYWLLYEGMPGGVYEPDQSFWATDVLGFRTDTPDYYKSGTLKGKWQWAYFGHQKNVQVLFVQQLVPDELEDLFGYLGNTEAGVESPDGMVVFGLGRTDGAKPLFRKPLRFRVGFLDMPERNEVGHRSVAEQLSGW